MDATDLSAALSQLPPDRRPHVVRVVERIPTSTSHRPLPSAFAEDGRPAPGPGVYKLDPLSGEYRTATVAKAVRTENSHALRSRG
jgi:putative long chain acyl-CoA synthase